MEFTKNMFKEYNQYQLQLLPPNLSDLISRDHIARLINHSVDKMDLSFIENQYSANGQKAYNPRMLLKVLVCGYVSGTRSSSLPRSCFGRWGLLLVGQKQNQPMKVGLK